MNDNEYGTIEYEGTTYTLETMADYTSSAFPGSYNEADEGDEYTAEIGAFGRDASGDRYQIVWRYNVIKGSEPALDEYDYGDVYEVYLA